MDLVFEIEKTYNTKWKKRFITVNIKNINDKLSTFNKPKLEK